MTVELNGRIPFWATVVNEHSKTVDGDCCYTVEDEHGALPAPLAVSTHCQELLLAYSSIITADSIVADCSIVFGR